MIALLTAVALSAKLAPASPQPVVAPRSHPAPFADRDRFLADLFGPQVEWLPPRSATQEQWREWFRDAEQPSKGFNVIVGSVRDSNREEWDPIFRDPWIKKWLTTSPGLSWRTLTDNGKAGPKSYFLGSDGRFYRATFGGDY